MKPWLLPYTVQPRLVSTLVPSALVIRGSAAKAASSHSSASSTACSGDNSQGCHRSSSGSSRAISSGSARPAQSSSEVCRAIAKARSEEHTSELQSRPHLVCRLLLEKKKHKRNSHFNI